MILAWTLVIGLAAFRLYRIAGVDAITEPFHGRLNASHHPVARWFSDLVSCLVHRLVGVRRPVGPRGMGRAVHLDRSDPDSARRVHRVGSPGP